MYIPKHFLNTNEEDVLSFMQKYSFATIVSTENNRPIATHLPFLAQKNDNGITLSSHFAKANPQSEAIAGEEVLVIFSEPHAYISPRHYEKEQTVPTWNYISVHVYGKCQLIKDTAQKFALLERSILNYEAEYMEQWSRIPLDYKEKLVNGIVGFDIEVTEIQAQNKLSQNKTFAERQSIIDELGKSSNTTEIELAEYMRLNTK